MKVRSPCVVASGLFKTSTPPAEGRVPVLAPGQVLALLPFIPFQQEARTFPFSSIPLTDKMAHTINTPGLSVLPSHTGLFAMLRQLSAIHPTSITTKPLFLDITVCPAFTITVLIPAHSSTVSLTMLKAKARWWSFQTSLTYTSKSQYRKKKRTHYNSSPVLVRQTPSSFTGDPPSPVLALRQASTPFNYTSAGSGYN